MSVVDGLRARWWRRGIDRRAAARFALLERAGAPFSEHEVLLLAFGTRNDWRGDLSAERWAQWGGAVCNCWGARLNRERVESFRARRRPPVRPEPWPTAVHGWPERGA